MKKEGFTLIELLAVIVILAIIALIATPIVLNIIENSKINSLKISAETYLNEIGKQIVISQTKDNKINAGVYSVPNEIKVEMSGQVPNDGWVKIEKGKIVDYALKYEQYIVYLDKESNNQKIEANIPLPARKVATNLSDNECVENANCTLDEIKQGLEVSIEVAGGVINNFYVISNENDKINLIMDKNLEIPGTTTNNIPWISIPDFESYGEELCLGAIPCSNQTACEEGKNCVTINCKECSSDVTRYGPVTALNKLKELTDNWYNVNLFSYTLIDDSGNNGYPNKEIINVRSRLMTSTEITNLSKTQWLQKNLKGTNVCEFDNITGLYRCETLNSGADGYWLSTSSNSGTANAITNVYKVISPPIPGVCIANYGLRPVVQIDKSMLN